jgi:hypothetical protein
MNPNSVAPNTTPASTSRTDEADGTNQVSRRDSRPEARPTGGRWWFAFDRWLAVQDVAGADEFVLA